MISTYHTDVFIRGKYMNNSQFFISEDSFCRAKKQLKKSLFDEGFNVNLSQCANLLARSFGYNNEYHIQEAIRNNKSNKITEASKSNNDVNETLLFRQVVEQTHKSNFNRIISEQRYFQDILFNWHCLNTYFASSNIFNVIEKLGDKLSKDKCIAIFKMIDKIKITIKYLERSKIIGENIFLYYERTDNKYIMQINEILPELIDLFELIEAEIGEDEILGNLIIKMGDLMNIEKYFYLNEEERHNSELQPDDFDYEYYKDMLNIYKVKLKEKDFKDCKDIIILSTYNQAPQLLATAIKENIRKNSNRNVDIILLHEELQYKIPIKNDPERIRIYIAYIKTHKDFSINNFDDIKDRLKKINNEDFNINDVSLFLKEEYKNNRISYDIVNSK